MKDERTFILTFGEMIHILATHFIKNGFFGAEQYDKGSILPSGDGKTYKFHVWKEEGEVDAFEKKEGEEEEKEGEEKPSRHIDLSDSYIEGEKKE